MNESWLQTLTIAISCIATVYYMHREHKTDIIALNARVDAQMSRIDQMYAIIVQMLKDGK